MTFQPVGGDTGSEHNRDNERPKRVTRDAFAPLRCKRRERRQGRFSQFGRVGGSQRRSDPQGSRWEVPATIISCKVNTEVRIRNVTTPSAQPACPSADISSQAHARALRPGGAGARPGRSRRTALELRGTGGAFLQISCLFYIKPEAD